MKKINLYDQEYSVNLKGLSSKEYKQAGKKVLKLQRKIANTPDGAPEHVKKKLIDELREVIKETIDGVLGAHSFNKLYARANYSISEMVNVFYKVMMLAKK